MSTALEHLETGVAVYRETAEREQQAAADLGPALAEARDRVAEVRALLAEAEAEKDRIAGLVAGHEQEAARWAEAADATEQAVIPRVRNLLADRIPTDAEPDPAALAGPTPAEVWSPLDAPGGYVCGAPVPPGGDGITLPDGRRVCGIPVESVPCDLHGPATEDEDGPDGRPDGLPDDPLVTMPDRREATPPPTPTEPSPRHAAPAEPPHTRTGPLRALVGLVTGRTGGHPTVTDGPDAVAALTALDTTGDTRA